MENLERSRRSSYVGYELFSPVSRSWYSVPSWNGSSSSSPVSLLSMVTVLVLTCPTVQSAGAIVIGLSSNYFPSVWAASDELFFVSSTNRPPNMTQSYDFVGFKRLGFTTAAADSSPFDWNSVQLPNLGPLLAVCRQF
uniref:(northern house mosquito) hypothetical protein n=1 Tax=Culex pipiens TaxID=7175 RepID=A0A8D8IZ17_CULPI